MQVTILEQFRVLVNELKDQLNIELSEEASKDIVQWYATIMLLSFLKREADEDKSTSNSYEDLLRANVIMHVLSSPMLREDMFDPLAFL